MRKKYKDMSPGEILVNPNQLIVSLRSDEYFVCVVSIKENCGLITECFPVNSMSEVIELPTY